MPEFIKGKDISSSKKVVSKNDVLLCKINPHLNRAWIVSHYNEDLCCIASSEWIICRSHALYSKFLSLCFTSPYFKEMMLSNVSGVGGSLMRAQPSFVGRYLFPLPPYNEQKRIVKIVEEWIPVIEKIEENNKNILANIQNTKVKILDFAIHGKLVPQDPNDEPAIELLKRINPKFTPCDNAHYENYPFKLPSSWIWTSMDDVNEYKSTSVDPSKNPNTTFELYSVPSFETGIPEFLKGKEISSSKKSVLKNDVLLCKINPHLNRAWIVSHHKKEMPCIASSEWIIIRNDRLCSEYLSVCFTTPFFKDMMLSNVSGVGGSLMRAQPSIVGKYPFPLPPVNEQKRIVIKIKELFSVLDEIQKSIEV